MPKTKTPVEKKVRFAAKAKPTQGGPENTVKTEFMELWQGNCMNLMQNIKSGTVDLICVDLPYGVTQNKWDSILPLEEMWNQFNRIMKENGVVLLTATQPFTSILVMSNLKDFKYDLIWEKTIASGQLNVGHQPLRTHESILVFYKKKPTYNEQKSTGAPYSISRKAASKENNYNSQRDSSKENTGFRHAKSVVKVSNPRIKGGHPTQKPQELMEYLIKTYSNEGDLVFDCCMGAGTTGVAAVTLKRNFLGIELNKVFFETSTHRIEAAHLSVVG